MIFKYVRSNYILQLSFKAIGMVLLFSSLIYPILCMDENADQRIVDPEIPYYTPWSHNLMEPIFPYIDDVQSLENVSCTSKRWHITISPILQNKIIFIGVPGSGASTLTYLAMGNSCMIEDIAEESTSRQIVLSPIEMVQNLIIGHESYDGESFTKEPTPFLAPSGKKILIDCPPLESLNSPWALPDQKNRTSSVYKLLNKGRVHIVLILSINQLYNSDKLAKLQHVLPKEMLPKISLVISKLPTSISREDVIKRLEYFNKIPEAAEITSLLLNNPSRIGIFTAPSESSVGKQYSLSPELQTLILNDLQGEKLEEN